MFENTSYCQHFLLSLMASLGTGLGGLIGYSKTWQTLLRL